MNRHKDLPGTVREIKPADLSNDKTGPAMYSVDNRNGFLVERTLRGRPRQVLELLMEGPIRCGSTVRLSAAVRVLRTMGFSIETRYLPGRIVRGQEPRGYYVLLSEVEHLLYFEDSAVGGPEGAGGPPAVLLGKLRVEAKRLDISQANRLPGIPELDTKA